MNFVNLSIHQFCTPLCKSGLGGVDNAVELATAVGREKSALAGVPGELTGQCRKRSLHDLIPAYIQPCVNSIAPRRSHAGQALQSGFMSDIGVTHPPGGWTKQRAVLPICPAIHAVVTAVSTVFVGDAVD